MPKIVDPQQRRAEIAAAVHRVVDRGGIEAASLRTVADEAGLNIGSVRHYVDSHDALLVLAAEQLQERVESRIRQHIEQAREHEPSPTGTEDSPDPRTVLIALLEELLPLDEERRHEVVLYFAFCEAARARPSLRPTAQALIGGVHEVAGLVLAHLGLVGDELAVAATSLASAIDGMALAALHAPDLVTPQRMRAVLDVHLGLAD